jgi:glycosyltransferase involved in cell wall biosynthesis
MTAPGVTVARYSSYFRSHCSSGIRESALPRQFRVAVVIPRYFPIYGGAENQCRALCGELQKLSRVKIAFILTKRIDPNSPRAEFIDGISIRRLASHGIGRWGQYIFYCLVLVMLVLRRKHYDVIHSHASGLPGLFATMAGMIARRPVILKISANGELLRTHRESSNAPFVQKLWKLVTRLNARHAYMVALNQEGYEEAIAVGATNISIISNGVDPSMFRPASGEERDALRRKYRLRANARVLLFSGRFVQLKGIHVLADAFMQVISNTTADLVLLLAGSADHQSDSARATVDDLASRAGGRVRVLPPVNPPIEYLKLADAFVFPSSREGTPNSVLEAIATGLPCILSDIAPHVELAVANPGAAFFLFRAGDPADLARAIGEYLNSPDRRPDDTGLNRGYHIRTVAERYLDLYERVATHGVL